MLRVDGNGHATQVHPDQHAADIHSRPGHGPDILDDHGVFKNLRRPDAPRAACMQARLHADLLEPEALHARPLNDDGAVQMLAALAGQKQAARLYNGQDLIHDRAGNVLGGMRSHVVAEHAARAAPDHDDIPGLQGRDVMRDGSRVFQTDLAVVDQLGDRGPCLLSQLFQCKLHYDRLRAYV